MAAVAAIMFMFGSALPRRHPTLDSPDQHARPEARAQVMANRHPLRSECSAVHAGILYAVKRLVSFRLVCLGAMRRLPAHPRPMSATSQSSANLEAGLPAAS